MVTRSRLLIMALASLSWASWSRAEELKTITAVARVMSFLEGLGSLTKITVKNKDGVEYATIDDPSGFIHDCVVQTGGNTCQFALLVRCAKPGNGVLYEIDFAKVTPRYETKAGTGPFDTDVIFQTRKDALKRNGISVPLRFSTHGPVEMPALLDWLKFVQRECPPLETSY